MSLSKSSVSVNKQHLIMSGLVLIIATSLSGCGKSEVELCIDKQSHLWDNKTNDKNANKAYWAAVAECKKNK